ncbi:hypothetical protein PR202_ga18133 [Eleusine coracana subsp. coracana]|uniref:Uncharacterized protein n=1 Tax=Eleusine coracana subsp. coracana TaxID=191504 RepID=A0AAV5CSA7_ELECO|nr:hypothetical protein PR202_ga18133 [Eleusine coracana subsp. coracana]
MMVARSPREDGSWVVTAKLWPRLAEVIEADPEAVLKPATAARLGFGRVPKPVDMVNHASRMLLTYVSCVKRPVTEHVVVRQHGGFVSSSDRDEIIKGLEKIEDEIENGKFEWIENKDVRSNIVRALIDRVGEPARKLDATSRHVQKLIILRIWLCDSADKIVTQIKLLQVELVLFALRNWGFVLPHILGRANWILLADLILSKVELLEKDVSQLRTCRDNIDSMLHINFQLGGTDGCANRLSEDGSHLIQNTVITFANMITGEIAINLSSLEQEMCSWMGLRFLTPNDKVTESVSLLRKHITDLDKVAAIRSDSLGNNCIQDVSRRFLNVYKIVEQILKVAADIGKNAYFNHEKIKSSLSIGSIKTSGIKNLRMVKVKEEDQSEKKKDEDEHSTQDLKSRSDLTMKRLLDWLVKHKTGENLLTLCTL